MKEAVIVSGVRTAGGKAPRGTLRDTRPEFMGALTMKEAIKRAGIEPGMIDDVIWGAATPEQACGMNTARITAIRADIPIHVPAVTVNRFCSSGLQAISMGAEAIISNRADIILAGGIEHMSMIAMGGVTVPDPEMAIHPEWAKVYTSMGQTAENVASRYGISRIEQDEMGVRSNQRAIAAREKFKEEIVPVPVKIKTLGPDGKPVVKNIMYDVDEGAREGVTVESLGKLKPAFVPGGSVTAGNSSQTTDGAASVIVMSADKARELGIKPRLKYVGYAVAGCGPDEMGVGPVYAIPKALKRYGLSLNDIGLIELNEAFASQACYCIRELGLNPDIVNVNGGAIAIGHPMGATGAKLTVTLMHEMERRKVKYGMVSMCIGGGQGAAGIFELCD
ncbi:MAG: thiolase family protein [Syntrophomonadaceae bacterium]|nr:thiolase family protein [Syntrophomonadaceae bacterium]